MCGRVALFHNATYYIDALRRYVEENMLSTVVYTSAKELDAEIMPRYNVSPTSNLLAVTNNENLNISMMRWGLVPSWAKDDSMGIKCFNARSETMAEKPSFRTSFKRSRCLIPIDGYYEWKTIDNKKVPFYMHTKEPLFLAGLCEPKTNTMSIVTKESQGKLHEIHHRQPIPLTKERITDWLDHETPHDEVLAMIQSQDETEWDISQVSQEVNNARNEGSHLIDPLTDV